MSLICWSLLSPSSSACSSWSTPSCSVLPSLGRCLKCTVFPLRSGRRWKSFSDTCITFNSQAAIACSSSFFGRERRSSDHSGHILGSSLDCFCKMRRYFFLFRRSLRCCLSTSTSFLACSFVGAFAFVREAFAYLFFFCRFLTEIRAASELGSLLAPAPSSFISGLLWDVKDETSEDFDFFVRPFRTDCSASLSVGSSSSSSS
mmetsp:Transcript_5088/g.15021  ORF Transcript_5088/g.15021 Transcript_5088/m.15021 type:complete len:203 (-) Transcript_5088:358-966(-)